MEVSEIEGTNRDHYKCQQTFVSVTFCPRVPWDCTVFLLSRLHKNNLIMSNELTQSY